MNLSSRSTTILLSCLPGWGHVYLGREGRGLIIFTAAATSSFALLNGTFVYLGDFRGTVVAVSAIAVAGLCLYSVLDVLRLTAPTRLLRLRRARDELLWDGTLCFLRSDFLAAEQKFLECARFDALDVEPVFRAGVAASRRSARGDAGSDADRAASDEARRLLRRAVKLDVELTWQWEIVEELKRLDAGVNPVPEAATSATETVTE